MKFKRQKPQQTRRQVVASSGRPQAFSYHARRAEQELNLGRDQSREQDARKHERIMKQFSQRFGLLIVAIVLVICLFEVLQLSSTPKIVALTASSSDYFLQATSVYQQAATKQFASSIFNANKVTINTAAIQQNLKKQFPELSDVSITLPLVGHRPIVYVAPTTPSLILNTTQGNFILDASGKALLNDNQVAELGKLQLATVTDQSGLHITLGASALPSSSVAIIQTISAELKAKAIAVDTLTLPPAAYELDVKPTGVPYFVKFNLHNSTEALQQVGTYLAVRQRLTEQGITPAAYIDVRLAGRAYYK